jgi:hypothetical protein
VVGDDVGVDLAEQVDVAELVVVLPQRIEGGVVGGVFVAGFELGGCPDVDEGGCFRRGRGVRRSSTAVTVVATVGPVLLVQPVRAVRAVAVM